MVELFPRIKNDFDALAPLGVRLTELPMTPERILAALRAAGHAG